MAVVCFPPAVNITEDNKLAIQMYPYFLFISSVFLITTFVVYSILPEMRNIHGVTIMCFVASLTCMYVGLGIIQLRNKPGSFCVANGTIYT